MRTARGLQSRLDELGAQFKHHLAGFVFLLSQIRWDVNNPQDGRYFEVGQLPCIL